MNIKVKFKKFIKIIILFSIVNIAKLYAFANIIPMGMGVMQISFTSFTHEEKMARVLSIIQELLTYVKEGQKAIINTALIYGITKGQSERLLADVILQLTHEERKKLIVVTWVGLDEIAIENETYDHQLVGPESMYTKEGAYAQFINGSFKNLKMNEFTDIEFWVGLHRVNPTVPVIVQAKQLKMIAENPAIAKVGISESSLTTIEEFKSVVPITFLETEFSLSRQFVLRDNILDYCKQNDIILLAYSPLDRGIWTSNVDVIENWLELGKAHPFLSQLEGWTNEKIVNINFQERKKALAIAQKHDMTINQVALSWLMIKGAIPIPDSTSPARSAQNFKSMKLKEKLTEDDIKLLDSISFEGKRYK